MCLVGWVSGCLVDEDGTLDGGDEGQVLHIGKSVGSSQIWCASNFSLSEGLEVLGRGC